MDKFLDIKTTSTGLKSLDEATNGLIAGTLITIAGRPSMGKTSLAITMALNQALQEQKKPLFFNLESASPLLVSNMLANLSEVSSETIRKDMILPEEWSSVTDAAKLLEKTNIIIDSTANMTISHIVDESRKAVESENADIIYIDNLQQIVIDEMKLNSYTRNDELGYAVRQLKQLAKELNIPIVVVSLLNRNPEWRKDGLPVSRYRMRPALYDLRESGVIEDESDLIIFLHRPEYYLRSREDDEGNDIRNLAEAIIAKNRYGVETDAILHFDPLISKFEDWETGCTSFASQISE